MCVRVCVCVLAAQRTAAAGKQPRQGPQAGAVLASSPPSQSSIPLDLPYVTWLCDEGPKRALLS